MIIPGIVSATFREKTAEDIIRLCREAHLQAVEWSENAHVLPDDPEGAAELYKKTADAGLKVAAYGSYYRLGKQSLEDAETVFRRSLRSAAALHAPLIRIWAGSDPSEQVSKERRAELAKEASMICDAAREYGIKVAMEWHKNTLTDTNQSAVEFLEEVSHENLYCLWQPTVALSMEERKEGLDLLREKGRLLNLHMYYWLDGVRRPFSEGIGEWRQYLDHVDRKEDRYGLLEFVMGNTEEQFLEDAKALHELLGRS